MEWMWDERSLFMGRFHETRVFYVYLSKMYAGKFFNLMNLKDIQIDFIKKQNAR